MQYSKNLDISSQISRIFSGIFFELGSGAVPGLSRSSDLLGIKQLSRERSGNEIVQSVADTHRKPVDASLGDQGPVPNASFLLFSSTLSNICLNSV